MSRPVISDMPDGTISITPDPSFRTAMILAVLADALQIVVLPVFAGGAASPAEDGLDFLVAAALIHLLGWHWEFLPSFLAKLVPAVDLAPFWTIAVANVYRKSKRDVMAAEQDRPSRTLNDAPRP